MKSAFACRDTTRPLPFRGSEVVLGIRPECIAEAGRGFAGTPGAPIVVSAPVEMIEPTGAEDDRVAAGLAVSRLLARISPDIRAGAGCARTLLRLIRAASACSTRRRSVLIA